VTYPDGFTIGDVLSRHAADRADERAFLFLDRGEREAESWTFSELFRRAQNIAAGLQEQGLRGERLILAYPSSLEFIAALFGCFYAGAIAVPAPLASYRNSTTRIRSIAENAGARAVLSLGKLIRGDSHGPADTAPLQIPGTVSIATDEIPGGGSARPESIQPGDVALLQYTSGSTGSPRGVIITHGNLMHNQRVVTRALRSQPQDCCVSWLPFFHDMGLMGGVLHPLYVGFPCVLMAPLSFMQKPVRWLKAISRYRGSISMAPCFAYDLCTRYHVPERDRDLDFSSWRVAICGGESIRPRVLSRFAELFRPSGFDPNSVLAAYGLAEATLLATSVPDGTGLLTENARDDSPRQLACCGNAWEGQRVAIVDPESCRRVAPGHTGEIWLQGESVALGYWNRAEETRATFQAQIAGESDAGLWLRTGDLGFLGAEGLVVTGRRKETIVIRGVNYDPLDIEAEACNSHPGLASAAAGAFAIDHEDGEAVVLALEVERGVLQQLDMNLLVGAVVSAVNRRFGLTLHDLALLQRGRIPRTTSGKIQRHLCKQQYLAGDLRGAAGHPSLGCSRARRQSA
jgi:acyl-CoA synthetase (AMP-forming)/AMP-acid ligase II